MTEAVEILIKADDQASQKFDEVSANLARSMKQAEGILRSLEEPADKYARQLQELKTLHAEGTITAEQFAAAEGKIAAKLKQMADDKAAKKLAEETRLLAEEQKKLAQVQAQAAAALEAEQKKLAQSQAHAASVMQSLETPAERYAAKLRELKELHAAGLISANQYATAQSRVTEQMHKANNALKEQGRHTKSVAEFAAVLANLTGNSQLAGLANQMGAVTDKVSQFSEVSKAGGLGALAFKGGLIALAAAGGFAIGKVIADWVWETKKFERALADAKEQAAALDQQLKQLAQTRFSEQKQDIELIRDPEQKRAAYQQLFQELQRDIAAAGARAAKSKKDAEEWADAWQITGDRKQYAEDAANQAKADRERVEALKAQATEIGKLIGQRAQQNALIAAENAAKDKSENYLENLRQEIEYLAATREEQIKLDAARNTTAEDRGEAERLLQERDALIAKTEAAKELEATQQRAAEEAERAAKQAATDAENERKRIGDLEKSIRERIELKRIELTQGKEAARVQELINQGIDAATARQLAAQEAMLEPAKKSGGGAGPLQALSAMEGRLLTRGPGRRQEQFLEQINRYMQTLVATTETQTTYTYNAQETLEGINKNTSKTTQMVPVT